jgi:hypothetical protein
MGIPCQRSMWGSRQVPWFPIRYDSVGRVGAEGASVARRDPIAKPERSRLRAVANSLRLDVGCPDDLGPFVGFIDNELAEIGGRDHQGYGDQVGKPRFDLGIGKGVVESRVEGICCGHHEERVAIGGRANYRLGGQVATAPGRFSTTICWPSRSDNDWPIMRATRSVGPPAGKPTNRCTGRDG